MTDTSVQERAAALLVSDATLPQHSDTFKYFVRYDVPRQLEMARDFAREAEISADGKDIKVGRYKAHKFSMAMKIILSGGALAGRKVGRWEITSEPRGFYDLDLTPCNQPERIISTLALKEAFHHLSGEDIRKAQIEALQARLAELKPV